MTTLAAKNPTCSSPWWRATSCTQAVTEAAQNGMHEQVKYLFQPGTCAGTAFVKKEKVGGDGSAANGWWIVNPASKDLTDKALQQDDPYVKWARELLQAAGHRPRHAPSLFSAGFILRLVVRAVRCMIAGQLPGGLTRTNLIVAQRAVDMTNPVYSPGVKFHMDGNKDAFFVEARRLPAVGLGRADVDPQGPVIDLDGKSSNCAWNAAAAVCQ